MDKYTDFYDKWFQDHPDQLQTKSFIGPYKDEDVFYGPQNQFGPFKNPKLPMSPRPKFEWASPDVEIINVSTNEILLSHTKANAVTNTKINVGNSTQDQTQEEEAG